MCSMWLRVENPDIIIAHSSNIIVMQQASFVQQDITTVCIATRDTGYVAVGKRTETGEYKTIGAYAVNEACAVSFVIPFCKYTRYDKVPQETLKARYQDEQDMWETIQSIPR